jgi:kinesin family protein 1
MHIHSVPDGEEICVVSLRNSRVDHSPQIAKLLSRSATNGDNTNVRRGRAGERQREDGVFAVYGTNNTWLFKARNEREKVEWIFKIDQAYFGSGSGSGSGEDEDFR